MGLNQIPIWWTCWWSCDFDNQYNSRIIRGKGLLEGFNGTKGVFSFKDASCIAHTKKQKNIFPQIEMSPGKEISAFKLNDEGYTSYRHRTLLGNDGLHERRCCPNFVYEGKRIQPIGGNIWQFPNPITYYKPIPED